MTAIQQVALDCIQGLRTAHTINQFNSFCSKLGLEPTEELFEAYKEIL